MYGLRTTDGFQARCLRKILKVPAAFISRVSNEAVRRQAAKKNLSSELLKQQLQTFGSTAIRWNDPLRESIFVRGTITLIETQGVRRQGRPRHTWADQIKREAVKLAGSEARLEEILTQGSDLKIWNTLVSEHTCAVS